MQYFLKKSVNMQMQLELIFFLGILLGCCRCEVGDGPQATDQHNDLAGTITPSQPEKSSFEKTFFPKDFSESSNARAIMEMKQELSSVEEHMKDLNDGVESLRNKNEQLELAFSKHEASLKILEKGVFGIEKSLAANHDLMNELMEIIGPDEKTYAISNHTCGGSLVGQAGYIAYTTTNDATSSSSNGSHDCVWVIQAGHHSFIKFSIQTLALSSNMKAYVVELINDKKAGEQQQQQQISIKKTILSQGLLYHVRGPIAFIVISSSETSLGTSYLSYASSARINLHLRYEGTGRLAQRKTKFLHKHLNFYSSNYTSFNANDLERWKNEMMLDADNENANDDDDKIEVIQDYEFSSEQSIIVMANLETRANLKILVETESCSNNGSSFMMIPNLLENGTTLTDFCEHDSVNKWRDGGDVIYGTPLVFLITKSTPDKISFKVDWETEKLYSGNWDGIIPRDNCRQVLGGTGGSVSFVTTSFSLSRCVWVIKPQNRNGSPSLITITGARHNLDSYVRSGPRAWYVVELMDNEGNPLSSPEVKNLIPVTGAAATPWRSHIFSAKELYVVFVADRSTASHRFSFRWYATSVKGNNNATVSSNNLPYYSPRYHFLNESEGSFTSELETGNSTRFPRSLYEVFILTQAPNSPSSFLSLLTIAPQMHLDLIQSSPSIEDRKCLSSNLTLFAPSQGSAIMTKRTPRCIDSGIATVTDNDGVALILVDRRNSTSDTQNNVTIDYNWRQGKVYNASTHFQQEDKCGGVVVATGGTLSYKLGKRYEGNERCIWLLHAPNCSSITLSLRRSGFYGSRYLVANTIDPISGKIEESERSIFTTASPTHHISRDFLVLLFQTINGSTVGTGFSIDFQGIDCRNGDGEEQDNEDDSSSLSSISSPSSKSKVHYALTHYITSPKTVAYKWTDERHEVGEDADADELHVIAYSEPVNSHTDTNKESTAIDWKSGYFQGTFRNNGTCDYDLIRFYTITPEDASTFYNSQNVPVWLEKLVYPEETKATTITCPDKLVEEEKADAFRTDHFSFLLIYKTVRIDEESEINTERRGIEFSYRKVDAYSPTSTSTTTSTTPTSRFHSYFLNNVSSSEEDYDWFGDTTT